MSLDSGLGAVVLDMPLPASAARVLMIVQTYRAKCNGVASDADQESSRIALEGARYGITANSIAPGLIETPILASMNGRAREKLISKVPLGRTGEPEDIAEAATLRCSPAAGYVTGVVLDVDGGIGMSRPLSVTGYTRWPRARRRRVTSS